MLLKHSYILLIFTLLSCKSNHKNTIALNSDSQQETDCPTDGVCKFEVLPSKKLSIKKDKFDLLYPKIDNGNNIVLKYTYTRNKIANTADSSYVEEVYIEINPKQPEITLADSQLSKANLLFARLCFCKGQTGYYKINKGNLKLIKIKKDTYHLSFHFKTDETPQIIHNIEETFTINPN